MNQTKLISVGDLVIDLLERTGDNTIERMKPTIARWAKWADQQISTKGQWKRKIVLLPIDGNQVDLPIDWVLIEYVVMGDQTANPYMTSDYFQNVIQTSILTGQSGATPVVFFWNQGTMSFNYIDWEIQFDKLVFPYDNLSDDQCTVVYWAYESDAQGLPMIRETHKDAVRKYIEVALMEREKWKVLRKGDVRGVRAFQQIVKEEMDMYHLFVRKARAEDGKLTQPELNQVSYMWNNPYSGRNNYILK